MMDGSVTPRTQPRQEDSVLRTRGLLIPKHPDILRGRIRKALRAGTYEQKKSDALLRAVNEGDTVVELGGGIGYLSALVAKKRHIKAAHVFEPNPELGDYITALHAANGLDNTTLHHAVLGARKGKPVPFYRRDNILAGSLNKDTKDGVVAEEQVEVLGLNATLKDLKPDVLVCDIQGDEAALLPHLKYDGLHTAIIELHPQWIGPSGVQLVFDAMQANGLTYFPRWSNGTVVSFRKGW